MNKLFAIDEKNNEVVISESQKGSKKIIFKERISQKENVTLYNAVMTLTAMSRNDNLDLRLFKAMDKICQELYNKYKEAV